ncbi:MAG: PH domain-containing protein [Erysipelotrichales bacterium]|nr:PH domain-containing protein [Erysipelotrichales bacterium]
MQIDERYFMDNSMQKNSIDDVICQDEKVLWRDKPNATSYVLANMFKMLPIALIWLIFDGTFIFFIANGMISGGIPTNILWFIIPFFLLHLMPVWMWIGKTIKAVREVRNIEYAITDKRIIIRSGVIGVDFKFINYTEIDSVNIKVGLIDRIFHVGDIYINSLINAGVLWDIKTPYKLGNYLQRVTLDIKSDIHYPNAVRPDSNPGYQTNYSKNPFDDK